ncbi:MAG: type II toxin-antitoxin system HicA family toxin [Patescibacteria group bacterium]
MPKLYSSRHVITVLVAKGFVFISQRGSHAQYRAGTHTVIVPMNKTEIPYGAFRSIRRQSVLPAEDFETHV